MGKISTVYKGDMLFESEIGKHRVLIDVPAAMGGSDRAPTPPEIFVASLGSCVAAFVVQYCERSGTDAGGIRVDVSFDKVENPSAADQFQGHHRAAARDCKQRREAWLRVAEHCIVHETISNMGEIELEVLDKTALQAG